MGQLKTFALLCALLLLIEGMPMAARSQQHVPSANKVDSLGIPPPGSQADSAAAARRDSAQTTRSADSLHHPPDSLGRMKTPSLVGTLDRMMDSSQYVTRDDLHWVDVRYTGSVLEAFPGVFIRDLGSAGQYNQINIRGQDWRRVAVLQNGRLMNDPASCIYNLYQLSTEFADRIEVVTGPRAFLYGLNSTGGAVNIVTRNYNSNRPFTKLNYSEGAYDYTLSDGTFSQNISRKVNLTVGYQFQGMDGRFLNSQHEAWNIRGKVRYNVSDDLNVIVSEYYTSSQTDMNGGIDLLRSRDPFDPRLAAVENSDAYEKITRHDMDLAVVGTFLEDTVNVSTLNFYYSHNLREYRDEEDRSDPNGITIVSDHTSSWMGASLTQNFHTAWQRFDAGLNVELRQVEGSPNIGRRRNVIASAWGKEELLLGGLFTVAGFGRVDRYRDHNYVGGGADVAVHPSGIQASHPSPWLTLFAGFSFSRRVPNYMELFWRDSTVSRAQTPAAETHRQLEAGAEFKSIGDSFFRAVYFHRTVKDPIFFLPTPDSYIFPPFRIDTAPSLVTNGVEASLRFRLWSLYVEGTGTYLLQRLRESTDPFIPRLSLSGGLYYWDTIVKDNLELKAGVRGRYRSSQSGEVFNPEALAYVMNAGTDVRYASSVDFFLIGHIGDAYIHLMWENLLNIEYYTTPYYPGTDRALRFGVSWEFRN